MSNKLTLWALATSFMFSTTIVKASEIDRDYFAVTSRLAKHMEEQAIKAIPQENTLVCPIGPKQILADLSQIADTHAQDEIRKFTGTDFEFDSYKTFIDTLPKNTEFPKESEKKADKWDHTPKAPKNSFFNGHFILSSDTHELDAMRTEQLRQLTAQVTPSDFSNPKQSADHVNGLVDTHTNHLISSIVSEDDFSGDPVALVLLSTLYINNSWEHDFKKRYIQFKGVKNKNTLKGFGETISLPYLQTASETTVMIPATGNTSLLVRMNHDGQVTPLDHDHIRHFLTSKTSGEKVEFSMPSFTIENTLDLQDLLKEAMPQLMNGKLFTIDLFKKALEVYVGKFVQKNKLDVTKDGLEGASATVMMLMAKCMRWDMEEYKKITIDRPFSFAVIKMVNPHQWLTLFTGQIFDPVTPKKK